MFGDSYSTPGVCVHPSDSFWMLATRKLEVDLVINYSWPGNSLDSVIHTLISDSADYDWERDFFLIGIPPLIRLTVASTDTKKSYHRRIFNLDSVETEQQLILCHHGLENKQFYQDPIAVRFEDPTWTEIQACRTIYLINSWLDSHRANYLLCNLSKDFQFDEPATGKFLLEKCCNHVRNILRGKTYWGMNYGVNKPGDYDQYGWAGHHGADGNMHFFENSVVIKLQECELV